MTDNDPKSVTTLPEGYQQVYYLSVLDENALLTLNIFSLVLLIVFGALTWLWQGNNNADWNISSGWIVPAVIGIFIIHEWIHGVAIRWAGQKPRYGVKAVKIGRIPIPIAFYATPKGEVYFPRLPLIIIALAPVVIRSLVGWVLIVLSPDDQLDWIISLAVIFNGSGAAGDIWMTREALRYGKQALIKDEADTIRIYAPIADPPATSAH